MSSRYDFEYKYRDFTVSECRKALNYAIKYLAEESYYKPLMDRFPLRIDNDIPLSQKDDLIKNNTCAVADGNNVYIDTTLMANMINGDIKAKENSLGVSKNLFDSAVTILAHEYTHILSLHRELGLKLWKKYKGKMPKPVVYAHIYACEVEANRGAEVVQSSAVYHCGVNDVTYPDAKPHLYYSALFEYFLKLNKEKQQEIAKMLQKALESQAGNSDVNGDSDMGKALRELAGTENNNKENSNGKNESNSDDGGDNLRTKFSLKGEKTEQNDNKDEDDDWVELTQEEIIAAINNANDAIENVTAGSEKGIGLESTECPYKPNLSPVNRLNAEYARWDEKRVKKELSKMKGLIRGEISKNRESTYARPTRRPISGNTTLIKKGVRYAKSYSPKVLIAMDSSGSMCSTTMKEVACAIENIFKDLGKPKVGSYICKHESQVSDVKPMREWKKVVESYRPSGGNCFLHVIEKANQLGVDVVLNIGDGQDVCNRSAYYNDGKGMELACRKFLDNNRKWFDVLVTNKNENRYYEQEKETDEKSGFHREGIYLGDKISKYFK